ncbi:MAG: adenylate/guanylate cyclase domain-containing protein, partial [Flavobacteriales bacterium]|nr:adenylate/guanylate cyclase domain-containing protein [Flavobacteriales bacterium]
IFFFIFFLYVKKSNKRNKELILNILPESIAVRIKSKGPFGVLVKQKDPIIIDEFEKSTILFTDFKGFTKIAESLTPEELVKELNTCFAKFDEISKNNTLEKIKTIGDAYMAAGGIPEINETNPIDAVKAGLEIVEFMKEFNREKKELGLPEWDIRVGINTGHIVAGVIGKHKYSYDIWGDAVNVASRMESSGEPSKVNISENTY